MKVLLILSALFTSLSTYASEYGKIYYSFDSENEARVVIVPADSENHFYINYKNFNHRYDNSTLLYEKIKNDVGDGFYYKLADVPKVELRNNNDKTLINGTVYSYLTVFLDDSSKTKIIYAGNADVVMARNVKKAYEERQLIVNSKISAKKLIMSAEENFNSTCRSKVDINIKWDEFSGKEFKASPAKLSSYLNALSAVCRIDNDYLEEVSNINKIKALRSNTLNKDDVSLNGKQLTIKIANGQENLSETSYQAIYNIFTPPK